MDNLKRKLATLKESGPVWIPALGVAAAVLGLIMVISSIPTGS